MSEFNADSQASSLRSPGELAIKTVATHLVALGNYAYMSTLQHRPTRSGLHVLRIAVLAFVPTLIIIEFVNTLVRSLFYFIQNQIEEDEEEKNVWFHLSAGLGVHASMPITNSTTKKDEIHRVPLLNLDPTLTERERVSWSWSWAGKMFATLFALTQAIGTIFMWARRIHHDSCLNFDHRNGAMGIASSICSISSMLILLLRYDWSVSRALQSSSTEKLHASRTTLIFQTFLAMTLHLGIASLISDEHHWLYTSSGVVGFIFGVGRARSVGHFFVGIWQTILLAIVVLVFRKEIGARLGADSSTYQAWIRHRSWKRIKVILKICLVLWFTADILRLFVKDIIRTIERRGFDWDWWQDPISDKIFVI
jgi:hypothetical protein